jgi:hypothetical protein
MRATQQPDGRPPNAGGRAKRACWPTLPLATSLLVAVASHAATIQRYVVIDNDGNTLGTFVARTACNADADRRNRQADKTRHRKIFICMAAP